MSSPVYEQIVAWLQREGVTFRHIHHEPTFTSEASAKARGEDVKVGGKALVVKVGDSFKLFVVSAALRFDSGAVKAHFSAKKTRFATPDELLELTGLAPGAVPPFGPPILKLPLYADPSVLANPVIAFNAGSLTDSAVMAVDDYVRIAKPEILTFAQK